MKTIDKTNESEEWDYGTVLKCWNDSPDLYDLYRVATAQGEFEKCELDILHDEENNERAGWGSYYDNIDELKQDLLKNYKCVLPVKATITIENL